MTYELCYTSVPQGLRVGSSGFCTVGLTRGTPAPLVERLESLSGYRPLIPAGSAQAGQNPVSWAHWRVSAGGRSYSVLSRVCFAGLDYTQRSNKFAHHVALTAGEQPAGGPAWTLLHANLMRTGWSGPPVEFDREPLIPAGDEPPRACAAWAAACGDAGWAGVLVDAFVNSPTKPAYVIYPSGLGMLPLIGEALALVPAQQRWQVTFNTYHTDLPAGLSCAWRCCVAGSPAAADALRSGGIVIDLSARLNPAPEGAWVHFARAGTREAPGAARQAVEPMTAPQIDIDDDDDELEPLPVAASQSSFGVARTIAAASAAAGSARASWRPTSSVSVAAHSETIPPLRAAVSAPRNQPPDGQSSGGGKAKWIALAAVWGVAVGAAVYFIVQRQADDQLGRLRGENQRLAEQSNGQTSRIGQLQADLDAMRKDRDATAKKLADAQKPAPAALNLIPAIPISGFNGPPDANLAKQIVDQDKQISDLNAKLAAQSSVPAPPPAEIPQIVLVPLPDEVRRLDGMPQSVFDVDAVPYPSPDKTFTVGKVRGASGTPRCRLTPLASADSSGVTCKNDESTASVSRVSAGGLSSVALCSFSMENGNAMMQWPLVKRHEDDSSRKEFLKYSMLAVEDDSGLRQQIQFFAPDHLTFNTAIAASADLPASTTGRITKMTLGSGSPWEPDDASGLTAHCTRGGTTIKLYIRNGKIGCSYFETLATKKKELAEKQSAWESSIAALPHGKDGKVDLAALQDAGLKHTAEACEEKGKEFKLAQENVNELKNPKSFPDTTAVVQAQNGVVLCRIEIALGG